MRRFRYVASTLTLLVSMTACKPALIPGTQIEESSANRVVLDFMVRYRDALVARDPKMISELAASDYFEDNGTIDQADDYGFSQLTSKLKEKLAKTKEIQIEIMPQKISREKNLIRVDYCFKERALVVMPSGEKWVTHIDVNRLVLRTPSENLEKSNVNSLKIVSGL